MHDKIELNISIPNKTRYLSLLGNIGENLARTLDRYGGDREELAYHINVVLTESTANAMLHGNTANPDEEIRISIGIDDECLRIRVYDHGQGFDINALPPPDENALDDHGRGIHIIRCLMDKVSYRKVEGGGNVLEMVKRLSRPPCRTRETSSE
jgi:serine/threonine-protein kinase RsbW